MDGRLSVATQVLCALDAEGSHPELGSGCTASELRPAGKSGEQNAGTADFCQFALRLIAVSGKVSPQCKKEKKQG